MSAEDEFAGRVHACREDEFAGRVHACREDEFAGRVYARWERGFAGRAPGGGRADGSRAAFRILTADERIRKMRNRSANGTGMRLLTQNGSSLAEKIGGRCGRWSACRISKRLLARAMEDAVPSGAGALPEVPLILFRQQKRSAADKFVYQLLLRMNQTWQSIQVQKEKDAARRDVFAQNIVKRIGRIGKPGERWAGKSVVQKELTVFRDIATIFVNRGSRPDLAKKAERELVKILSRESRQNRPEGKTAEDHLSQKRIAQEELVTTKRTVAGLEEQINRQKTLLLQIQKTMETIARMPEPDMGRITAEVMKRMEREMHLERLRRGWG